MNNNPRKSPNISKVFHYVATALIPVYWYCVFHYDWPRLDFLIVIGFYISSWVLVFWVVP